MTMFYTKKKEIKTIASIVSKINKGSFPLDLITLYYEIPFEKISEFNKILSTIDFKIKGSKGIFYVIKTFELNEYNLDSTIRLMILIQPDIKSIPPILKMIEDSMYEINIQSSHTEEKNLSKSDLMIEINPIHFYGSKSKLMLVLLRKYGVKSTRLILNEVENPITILYDFKSPNKPFLSGL